MAFSVNGKQVLKTALEKFTAGNARRDSMVDSYLQEYSSLAHILELSPYFQQERLTTIAPARRQLRNNELEKLYTAINELDNAQTALENVNNQISELIQQRNAWLSTSPLSDIYESSLSQLKNMEKVRQESHQINREVAEKLAEFEGNPFYDYLKARNYGTDAYIAKKIPTKLDALLAKFCVFGENSHNEEMLQNIKNQSSLRMKKTENAYKNIADSYSIEVMKMEKEIGLTDSQNGIAELLSQSDRLFEHLKVQLAPVSEISENTVTMYTRAHQELGKLIAMEIEPKDKVAATALRDRLSHIVHAERETSQTLKDMIRSCDERIRNNKKTASQQNEAVRMGSKEASSIMPKAVSKKA